MPDFCTCGAQLPEDARFCHKCGKPQREEPHLAREEPPEIELPPPVRGPNPQHEARDTDRQPTPDAEPLRINFSNGPAVRAALLAGALAFLLSALLGPLSLLAPIAGGFLAVFLYNRRTGQRLSIMNGARLGWISGVFIFVMATLLVTLSVVILSQPELVDQLRQQMADRSSMTDAELDELLRQLQTPSGLIALMIGTFLSTTLLPALGGAVGAKLLKR